MISLSRFVLDGSFSSSKCWLICVGSYLQASLMLKEPLAVQLTILTSSFTIRERLAGTDWALVATNDGQKYYYNTKTKVQSISLFFFL